MNVTRERKGALRRRAFTLIEVLIVIAILLALFGIVAGTFLRAGEKADVDLQKVQLKVIDGAMAHFRLDMKRFPTEEEGLEALWDKTILESEEDEDKWGGPYLEEPIAQDKWGNDLIYIEPGENEAYPYDLISMGPDGEEGTEDDITNHRGGDADDDGFEDFSFEE